MPEPYSKEVLKYLSVAEKYFKNTPVFFGDIKFYGQNRKQCLANSADSVSKKSLCNFIRVQ